MGIARYKSELQDEKNRTAKCNVGIVNMNSITRKIVNSDFREKVTIFLFF